ncbi:MAG: hypothetical protein EHM91_00130 [Planctomycetota bacterium]|nr:MAG: hypothetical protein EHM91_00130 [Planctomycetota bacterium]
MTAREDDGQGLPFDPPAPMGFPSARPIVEMRWHNDGVEAYWPEFKLTCWVCDWATALEVVVPETISDHVQIRVRV